MMNNICTRYFRARDIKATGADRIATCPLCMLRTGCSRLQTKEHILIYGGECILAKEIKQQGDKEMQEIMKKWGMNTEERKRITEIYEKEEKRVTETDGYIEGY